MAYTYKPYEESEAVKRAKEALEAHNATKPADYTSNWQSQIDATLSQIQNRKPFTYDLNADALYQQYKDMATAQGILAMMDTMGQAAALTGGYGSSYGQNVGQQAYNSYLQSLNDKVPELYQLALGRYNQEGEDLYNMYALLGDREANDYAKWQDLQNAYESERNYLTNLYDTERGYDYSKWQDDQSQAQWQAEFDEAVRQYNQNYAFNERKRNEAEEDPAPVVQAPVITDNKNAESAQGAGVTSFTNMKRTIGTLFGTGKKESAVEKIAAIWSQLSKDQKAELKNVAIAYGYEIEED